MKTRFCGETMNYAIKWKNVEMQSFSIKHGFNDKQEYMGQRETCDSDCDITLDAIEISHRRKVFVHITIVTCDYEITIGGMSIGEETIQRGHHL